MRTKILKFGMPLMAFLLAIVFAFATNGKPEPVDTLVNGYLISTGCNTTPHNCTEKGNIVCKVNGENVFRAGCSSTLMRSN